MSTNTKLTEAARQLDDAIKDLPDGCEGWLEPLDERIAELRAALAAHDAEQAAKAVPAAWKPAPVYRGYALLGTGRYLLDSTDAPADPELGAELIISIASEKDREGREIGERRDMPARTIQPDDMAVRIGFANERGLFALEDQLWMLRQEHWPGTKSAAMLAAAPTPPAPEAQRREPLTVPHPGSPEAKAMIDSELAFRDWPANHFNAARAGYEACRKLAGLGIGATTGKEPGNA